MLFKCYARENWCLNPKTSGALNMQRLGKIIIRNRFKTSIRGKEYNIITSKLWFDSVHYEPKLFENVAEKNLYVHKILPPSQPIFLSFVYVSSKKLWYNLPSHHQATKICLPTLIIRNLQRQFHQNTINPRWQWIFCEESVCCQNIRWT